MGIPSRSLKRISAAVASAWPLLALPAGPAAASAPLELTLRSEATVASAVVRLADVVFDCADEGLGSKELFHSPGWGHSRTVSREEIRRRLARVSRARVFLTGSESIVLRRPGGDRSQQLERALERAIAGRVDGYRGLAWEIRFPDGPIMMPWGEMTVNCTVPRVEPGNRIVRCQVRVGGETVKHMSVACRFSRRVSVPVASRRLTRGDTLRAGDLVWKEQTFASRIPEFVRREDTSGSCRVKRSIREGDVVTKAAVEPHPIVRAGQIVELILQRAAVRVSTRARALQTGWVGSRIRFQKLTNDEYVYGRVWKKGVAIHE